MRVEERERLEAARDVQICAENGFLRYTRFTNGRDAALMQLAFSVAIIADLTEWGHGDRWCYQTFDDARAALDAWSGEEGTEPTGWTRHPDTGRRRPDGDAGREYFNP